jgi:DNA-binding XRE family transcriptional regulator
MKRPTSRPAARLEKRRQIMTNDSPAIRLAKTLPRRKYGTGSSAVKEVWHCLLYERRTEIGLTLQAVAEAIGMSKTGLFAIEHGGDPQLTSAMKLAKFFAVPVEELWSELKRKD